MEVGLGPGHIVLDGDPAPLPQRRHSPQFSAHVYCGQTAGWIKMPLGTEVGLGPGGVLDAASCPQKGARPNFRPMSVVAKWSPISATGELFVFPYQPTDWLGDVSDIFCVEWDVKPELNQSCLSRS